MRPNIQHNPLGRQELLENTRFKIGQHNAMVFPPAATPRRTMAYRVVIGKKPPAA
jgi:hypothetical protein